MYAHTLQVSPSKESTSSSDRSSPTESCSSSVESKLSPSLNTRVHVLVNQHTVSPVPNSKQQNMNHSMMSCPPREEACCFSVHASVNPDTQKRSLHLTETQQHSLVNLYNTMITGYQTQSFTVKQVNNHHTILFPQDSIVSKRLTQSPSSPPPKRLLSDHPQQRHHHYSQPQVLSDQPEKYDELVSATRIKLPHTNLIDEKQPSLTNSNLDSEMIYRKLWSEIESNQQPHTHNSPSIVNRIEKPSLTTQRKRRMKISISELLC